MRGALGLGGRHQLASPLVLRGDDLDEGPLDLVELVEHLDAARALGALGMLLHQGADLGQLRFGGPLELDHAHVAAPLERVAGVIDIGHAAAHAGREVLAHLTQHQDHAAGHVLAAVVAHALHDQGGTGVAHSEPLAGQAVDKALPAGGAVERHVAHRDVLVELVGGAGVGGHGNDAAGQALTHVVVGLAADVEGYAGRQEGAETLATRALAVDGDESLGQALRVGGRDSRAQQGAHAAVDVGDVHVEADGGQALAGAAGVGLQQGGVQRALQVEVGGHAGQAVALLGARELTAVVVGHAGQQGREVERGGLPVAGHGDLAQALGVADHLVHAAKAQPGHDLAQLAGHVGHVVHNMLGLAHEGGAQAAVLGGDAGRAGVLLAVALHEAAHGQAGAGGEAELLGTQQGRHRYVAPVEQLAVGLQDHAGAQAVHEQGLLGLRQAELEGQAGVVDGVARGRAGAAVGARNRDLVGAALGHAGRNGAHARLGHELNGYRGLRICILEVKDQLGQILDGVDVVVGRRRDEAHAGGRAAHPGNPGVDLLAGQVAALAGLGALGHLNLDLTRTSQVAAGDAEAARGDLLDSAELGAAARQGRLPGRVLAALAGVGFAAQPVHGQGQALVGLLGDGPVAHGAGVETADDALDRLHLLERHGPAGAGDEVEQVAQKDCPARRVQGGAELAEELVAALAHGTLQQVDDLGRQDVLLASQGPPLGDARACQLVGRG